MRAQALRSSSTTFTGHDRKLDWTQAGRHMGCGKHRWWLYLLHCDASPMFKSSTSLKLNIGTFLSGEIFKKSMEDVHNKILLWFKNVLQQNKRTFLQNLSFFLSCFHSFIHSWQDRVLQKDKERQGNLLSSGSFPKWLHQPRLAQLNFRGQNLFDLVRSCTRHFTFHCLLL